MIIDKNYKHFCIQIFLMVCFHRDTCTCIHLFIIFQKKYFGNANGETQYFKLGLLHGLATICVYEYQESNKL